MTDPGRTPRQTTVAAPAAAKHFLQKRGTRFFSTPALLRLLPPLGRAPEHSRDYYRTVVVDGELALVLLQGGGGAQELGRWFTAVLRACDTRYLAGTSVTTQNF